MANITNQQLQAALYTLTVRVDRIEERMHIYEEAGKEHTIILKRVETTVNSYEQAIKTLARLFRYVLGVISIAAASVLAYWVLGLLHIHFPS